MTAKHRFFLLYLEENISVLLDDWPAFVSQDSRPMALFVALVKSSITPQFLPDTGERPTRRKFDVALNILLTLLSPLLWEAGQ